MESQSSMFKSRIQKNITIKLSISKLVFTNLRSLIEFRLSSSLHAAKLSRNECGNDMNDRGMYIILRRRDPS